MDPVDLEALRLEQVRHQSGRTGLPQMKRFNTALIEEYRASGGEIGGQLAGVPLLLITVVTASGGQRTVPLGYVKVGGRLLILASKGGAPDHPVWYRQLGANPLITVELGHEMFEAKAITTEGRDRESLFAEVVRQMPAFDEYQRESGREIPVIELQRVRTVA